MRRIIALLLFMSISIVTDAQNGGNTYKVAYDGGSLQNIKAGDGAKLIIDEKEIRLMKGKEETIVAIPANSITEISYGQDVHRRIGAAIGVAVFTLGIGRCWR